jgi:hypothetical protein
MWLWQRASILEARKTPTTLGIHGVLLPDHKGRLWLRDDLPPYVSESRLFLYEYNSTAVYGKDRDTFNGKANKLLEAIRIERHMRWSQGRFYFLGHSMGGLLIKQADQRA